MLTPDDKQYLRDWRDEETDPEDKRLLRKVTNHIEALETRLSTVRTLLRTALNETNHKSSNGGD